MLKHICKIYWSERSDTLFTDLKLSCTKVILTPTDFQKANRTFYCLLFQQIFCLHLPYILEFWSNEYSGEQWLHCRRILPIFSARSRPKEVMLSPMTLVTVLMKNEKHTLYENLSHVEKKILTQIDGKDRFWSCSWKLNCMLEFWMNGKIPTINYRCKLHPNVWSLPWSVTCMVANELK